jgi:hypothetical protein
LQQAELRSPSRIAAMRCCARSISSLIFGRISLDDKLVLNAVGVGTPACSG